MDSFFSDPSLVATVFVPNDGSFVAALRTYGISASQLLSNKAVLLKVTPLLSRPSLADPIKSIGDRSNLMTAPKLAVEQ